MSKWDLLRLQDVRGAYRLIGECRDVSSDPALWYLQMAEGLCKLIGAPVASGGEGLWLKPHEPIKANSGYGVGFEPRGHERLMAYIRENGTVADPIYTSVQHMHGALITCTRRQLVPDAEWYRS